MVWIIIAVVALLVIVSLVTKKTTEIHELHKVRAAFEHYEEAHSLTKDVLKGLHIAEEIIDEIEYESGQTQSVSINYKVKVEFPDDGKHFPYYLYSGSFDCSDRLTNREIINKAKDDMIEKYPQKNAKRTYMEDVKEGAIVSVYSIEKCINIK